MPESPPPASRGSEPVPPGKNDPHARPAGLSLFVLYFLLYAGFIAGTAFRPDIMALRVRDTVTVAVAYGMLLIVAAALLALLYLLRTPRDHG